MKGLGAGLRLLAWEREAQSFISVAVLAMLFNGTRASDSLSVKNGSHQVLLSQNMKHWEECLVCNKCSVNVHCCDILSISHLRSPAGRRWLPEAGPRMGTVFLNPGCCKGSAETTDLFLGFVVPFVGSVPLQKSFVPLNLKLPSVKWG